MLLVNIQLAIMGIVVVAGLFYLWRMICRVERKVDDFIDDMRSHDFFSSSEPVAKVVSYGGGEKTQEEYADEPEEDADDFMKEVFGENVAATVVISSQPSFNNNASVNVVEIEESDAGESTSTLSKSKVKRMSVEALREMCKERGLSTEGTKAALQERLLDAGSE
jgi:hypothetical protein